jgi:hypothetical protein
MMTPLDDDLLTALRAARPDPGYQPSAASPEAREMLARVVQARHRAPRRSRTPALILAAAAAAALAAGLTLLPGSTPGPSPAATRLLAQIATAAASQPSPAVRDSQFWYIKSWVSFQVCNGGSGNNCVMQKPHERQIWQSVSNLCVVGLVRENGQETTLDENAGVVVESVGGVTKTIKPQCPDRGHINDPTYRFLQSLPASPRTLLDYIYAKTADEGQALGPDGEAFVTIGDLLREAIAPPAVSAALYRAAALIPGVTVVPHATDAIGRHGVAVAYTYQGVRTEWIFSKQTFRYLGELDISTANGSITGEDAVLQRAFVGHAGQLPR